MDQEITRYLHDHLAGSSGGLLLIEKLAENHDDPEAKAFFTDLKRKVEADRDLLQELLDKIGQDRGGFFKLVGDLAARVSGIKLLWGRTGAREAWDFRGSRDVGHWSAGQTADVGGAS